MRSSLRVKRVQKTIQLYFLIVICGCRLFFGCFCSPTRFAAISLISTRNSSSPDALIASVQCKPFNTSFPPPAGPKETYILPNPEMPSRKEPGDSGIGRDNHISLCTNTSPSRYHDTRQRALHPVAKDAVSTFQLTGVRRPSTPWKKEFISPRPLSCLKSPSP